MKTIKVTLQFDVTPDLIAFIDNYDTGVPPCADNYDVMDWIADCPENLKDVMEYAKLADIPHSEDYEIVTYCDANLKEIGIGG